MGNEKNLLTVEEVENTFIVKEVASNKVNDVKLYVKIMKCIEKTLLKYYIVKVGKETVYSGCEVADAVATYNACI